MGGSGGQPDENKAGRIILKDFQSGKLLYCHEPPGSEHEFIPTTDKKGTLFIFSTENLSILFFLPTTHWKHGKAYRIKLDSKKVFRLN